MFLDISEMQSGSVRFDQTFAPGAFEFFDQQLRQVSPLVAKGTAQLNEATMEIRVAGHVSTTLEAPCDRCIEPVKFPIDADFALAYGPAATELAEGEVHLKDEETQTGFYEGEGIELTDVLREEILLLLPMQRVCSEECKGICPVCGQNRNQVACECRPEAVDDRWAGLRNL